MTKDAGRRKSAPPLRKEPAMRFLDPQHWLFSLKTFLAGMMALAVAFWLDLPRPYWALATVYISSQPLAGATRSKATFRAIGTLAGAAAAVAMVPNLVGAPLLLVLAMALWCGLCLYLSLLDRTPRGYAFMLAGYTAAIVGFPAVDAPQAIFDLALSRTEEILVGIGCAALVSSVLFPRAVGPVVAERVQAWLRDAKAAGRAALSAAPDPSQGLRLAADTVEIESLAAHLPFETSDPRALRAVREALPRMLMAQPEISAIADRLRELAPLGGPSAQGAALVARLEAALAAQPRPAGEALAELRRDLAAHAAHSPGSWRELVELNLFQRSCELLDLLADCAALAEALESGAAPGPLAFPAETRLARLRHDDRPAALRAAVTLAATLIVCCLFWILTAWRDGASAAMMAAVAGSLFAAQDDPAPSIAKFTGWSFAAVCVSAVYIFGLLPLVHNFETLALMLAPAFLFYGLLIAQPSTFLIGLALGILTPSAMALQELYAADAESFLNASLATIAGMGLAAVTTALVSAAGAHVRALRFLQANRLALAQAADVTRRRDPARALGPMVDRLTQLAPTDAAAQDALRQARAAFNIFDARHVRASLSAPARRRIDALLARLARHYRQDAPLDDVRAALHRALRALEPGAEPERRALLALVGLRSCLFPEAAPPRLHIGAME